MVFRRGKNADPPARPVQDEDERLIFAAARGDLDAFNQLGLPLLVYGDGRDRQALEAKAGSTISFLRRVSWDKLADLFQHCRAFVFPVLEDFGIAPLEAQAAGRPVIAYAGGGALDTIVDGETGPLQRSFR